MEPTQSTFRPQRPCSQLLVALLSQNTAIDRSPAGVFVVPLMSTKQIMPTQFCLVSLHRSGSADVLEELGVPMLLPNAIKECIEEANIAFM